MLNHLRKYDNYFRWCGWTHNKGHWRALLRKVNYMFFLVFCWMLFVWYVRNRKERIWVIGSYHIPLYFYTSLYLSLFIFSQTCSIFTLFATYFPFTFFLFSIHSISLLSIRRTLSPIKWVRGTLRRTMIGTSVSWGTQVPHRVWDAWKSI